MLNIKWCPPILGKFLNTGKNENNHIQDIIFVYDKNSHGGIKIENEWTHVTNTFPSKTLWDRLLKHFELNEYLKPFPQAHNYNKTCFRRNWSPKRGAPTASGWRRERSSRRREKTSRETWRVGSSREPCPTSKERSSTAGTSRGEGGRRQCSRLCASPGKVLTATSIFLENCLVAFQPALPSSRTTSHNQYLESGGITVYDNEAFDLVLTGIDLDMIKAIKFTTVTTVISTNTFSDHCRNHVLPHPHHPTHHHHGRRWTTATVRIATGRDRSTQATRSHSSKTPAIQVWSY